MNAWSFCLCPPGVSPLLDFSHLIWKQKKGSQHYLTVWHGPNSMQCGQPLWNLLPPDPFPWQWLLKIYQQGYGTKLTSHSQYWHATFGSCPRGELYTLAYHLGAQERCKRLGWSLSCSRPVLFQGTCWLHKIHSEGSSFSLSYHSLQSTIILQNVENEIKAVVRISK